ncbi:MAG: DUF86 domain-containing protein [Deltaproteobacteria bacterium]|nr:DUF86 domain-containing protein [Deltaproteobacteria bacterium]
MTPIPLDRETVLRRMNGIQEELRELEKLARFSLKDFSEGVGYKLAQFHLHRALEGVFHISTHILSRIPGGQATEYKAIARKLGEVGILDPQFANSTLTHMAGYRNRLVHFYAEVTSEELYNLLQNHLQDFEIFLKAIKPVLQNPQKYGILG